MNRTEYSELSNALIWLPELLSEETEKQIGQEAADDWVTGRAMCIKLMNSMGVLF